MDSYIITELSKKKKALTNAETGVIEIKHKNKKIMKTEDVKIIDNILSNKYKDTNVKYSIIVFSNLAHPITLKGLSDEVYNEDVFNEYLEGRVANKEKFDRLYSIQIRYLKTL